MDDYREYFDPRIISQLTGLALRARTIVEGYVSGVHRSPMNGFSVEFAEHREYAPGDDPRYLDWKAYGRSDKFYLKQFEEETNLACYLLLDVSDSMTYRGREAPMSKLEYARTVAAALAYLVLRQQDCVGLATFDTEVRSFVEPSGSPSHLEQIVRAMDGVSPRGRGPMRATAGQTDMAPVFHHLAERLGRRGIVIVLSDFFDDVPAMLKGLKHFRHRRQEVILLHIVDREELDFPFDDPTRFRGLEDNQELALEPRAVRRAYRDEFARYLHDLRFGCRRERIDHALLSTDESVALALRTYLASRPGGTALGRIPRA
jgi:uncharacterized protein (DUF58 family)